MPCLADPGACPAAGGAPEHLGELAFRERIAGLHAEQVRGHRCAIIGIGSVNPVTKLPAGRGSLLLGRLILPSPILSARIAVAVAVLPAVNGFG